MLTLIQLEFSYRDSKNKENRKANVVCTSKQNAIDFLRLGGDAQMINIGNEYTIHAYTDEALQYIFDKLNIKVVEDELPEIQTSGELPEENELPEAKDGYVCPWCEKSFEKPQGLKVHIQRMHIKKEE